MPGGACGREISVVAPVIRVKNQAYQVAGRQRPPYCRRPSHLKVTYRPGAPLADFDASAAYYTTIQKHSFATANGSEGIMGRHVAPWIL